MKVAVLGLGAMGVAIAARLESSGADLVVWNRSPRPKTDGSSCELWRLPVKFWRAWKSVHTPSNARDPSSAPKAWSTIGGASATLERSVTAPGGPSVSARKKPIPK